MARDFPNLARLRTLARLASGNSGVSWDGAFWLGRAFCQTTDQFPRKSVHQPITPGQHQWDGGVRLACPRWGSYTEMMIPPWIRSDGKLVRMSLSDVGGIHYVRAPRNAAERELLKRNLSSMGCIVRDNPHHHSRGDFSVADIDKLKTGSPFEDG